MAKKQPNNKKDIEISLVEPKPAAKEEAKEETAYIVKKISLSEWQIKELKIFGDMVVDQKEWNADIPVIVMDKLKKHIRGF